MLEKIKALHCRIENKWLVYSWMAGVLLVCGVLSRIHTAVQSSFFGIAEAKEIALTFEYPVKIKRVHVIPGQKVMKGDPLIELDQADLELRVANAESRLAEILSQMKLGEELAAEIGRKGARSRARSDGPLDFESTRIRAELALLYRQRKALVSYADADGSVASVSFSPGETASPYTPVVTVSRSAPSNVVGFVEEHSRSSAEIDQEVIISSIPDPSRRVVGKVAAIGNRITPFPKRLIPIPGLEVFGREIVIVIPPVNPLLVGEKVRVTSLDDSSGGLFPLAQAGTRK
jgi:multidrug resistance efflux pump